MHEKVYTAKRKKKKKQLDCV